LQLPTGIYDVASEFASTSLYALAAGGNQLRFSAFSNSANQRWIFTLVSTVSTTSAYYTIDIVSTSVTCAIDSSQSSLCGTSTGGSSQQWLVTSQAGKSFDYPVLTEQEPDNTIQA
jgi:hypothetical protein